MQGCCILGHIQPSCNYNALKPIDDSSIPKSEQKIASLSLQEINSRAEN